MKIIIGSKSDKKIAAVKKALEYLNIDDYTLESYKVESDISDNPLNEQTIIGAKNRNNNLKKIVTDYDMLISIEAGFTKEEDNYYLDTYCALEYKNKEYIGSSPRLKITKSVYEYVKNGGVLHLLVEKLQNTQTNEGVIGYLSCEKLTRTQVEQISVIDALIKALSLDKQNISLDINEYIDLEQVKKLDEAINKITG